MRKTRVFTVSFSTSACLLCSHLHPNNSFVEIVSQAMLFLFLYWSDLTNRGSSDAAADREKQWDKGWPQSKKVLDPVGFTNYLNSWVNCYNHYLVLRYAHSLPIYLGVGPQQSSVHNIVLFFPIYQHSFTAGAKLLPLLHYTYTRVS